MEYDIKRDKRYRGRIKDEALNDDFLGDGMIRRSLHSSEYGAELKGDRTRRAGMKTWDYGDVISWN